MSNLLLGKGLQNCKNSSHVVILGERNNKSPITEMNWDSCQFSLVTITNAGFFSYNIIAVKI